MSIYAFVKTALMGSIALFPLVDPIGSAIMANPLLADLSVAARAGAARRVTLYCLAISLITVLAGIYVLQFFGLTIPVVQVGGGLLMCRQSWLLISTDIQAKRSGSAPLANAELVEKRLFFPIAFPLLIGPETLAGLLTLSAHTVSTNNIDLILNFASLTLSIIIVCVLIYICLNKTPRMIRFLGEKGEIIVNQLSAFLFFCVGIQITETGIWHIIQGYLHLQN